MSLMKNHLIRTDTLTVNWIKLMLTPRVNQQHTHILVNDLRIEDNRNKPAPKNNWKSSLESFNYGKNPRQSHVTCVTWQTTSFTCHLLTNET